MLTLQSLSASYGSQIVLHEIDLRVKPGEVLALIGPNGAGKSTLIRGVSGILPTVHGQILCNGTDISTLSIPERARQIAVVPQARQLGGAFTVHQTVMIGRTAYMNWLGKPSEKDDQIVERALSQTAMTHLAERRIAEISGGEQQRALLARALAQSTPILLLDEPTNHLDLQHQVSLLDLVCRLAHEENLAILMAMHDLNLVAAYADRVALLVEGHLKGIGSPQELLTANTISEAYNTPIQVIPHPRYGTPLILPERKAK